MEVPYSNEVKKMANDLNVLSNMLDSFINDAKKDGIDNLVISAVLFKKAGEVLYKHCACDMSEYELMLNDNITALRSYLIRNKKGDDNVKI